MENPTTTRTHTDRAIQITSGPHAGSLYPISEGRFDTDGRRVQIDIWRDTVEFVVGVDCQVVTLEAPSLSQHEADAIVRLAGFDTLVEAYEFDSERGHVYLLTDGCAILVRYAIGVAGMWDLGIRLENADGKPTARPYGSTEAVAQMHFAVVGAHVQMYVESVFVGQEPTS